MQKGISEYEFSKFELRNAEKIDKIIDDYKQGDSPRDLNRKYGISRNTLTKIFLKRCIPMRDASTSLKRAYSKKPRESLRKNVKYLKKYYETHEVWNKREKIRKACGFCKSEFLVKPSRKNIAKYCSRRCADKGSVGRLSPQKGKTYEEMFGIQRAKEMKEKIRIKRREQTFSSKTRKKISEIWRTPEKQRFARERIIRQYNSGQFPKQTDTSIEQMVKKELIKRGFKLNSDFICQFNLYDRFACDFCFPKNRLIVECDGDWWHGNPMKYNRANLHPKQKKTIQKDASKDAYIQKIDDGSWHMVRFWGSDIKEDVSRCVDLIEQSL